MIDLSFTFTDKCYLWQSTGSAWYFIALPKDKSEEIKFFDENIHEKRRGWGAVRVIATVGNTTWETSIFPATKLNAYMLPLKAEVRKKEKFSVGDEITVQLTINM